MNLHKTLLLLLSGFATASLSAQQLANLSLDSCLAMAKRNYPLIQQYALIEKTRGYTLDNINKGYLPQLNVSGQATYQSEVTQVPIKIPNVPIAEMSKDQYKLYGEVIQPVTDLFTIKDQKLLASANAEVESRKVDVELYKLKERIQSLYFGVLLADAQLSQTAILNKDLQSGIDKINVAIANGTALKSNADILLAEQMKVNQRLIEIKAMRKAYLNMLGRFIHQELPENTTLSMPPVLTPSQSIQRPETQLFDYQKKTIAIQSKLITARLLPRFLLFFQGGMGRPALNMLNNDLNGYYLGGLRLNWNLNGLYTFRKEKKILEFQQNGLDVQKDVFLFNTRLMMDQQETEMQKITALIETDQNVVALRERIKNVSKTQLENGTLTALDYLSVVNAQDLAQQNLLLHQIQLLLSQYQYQTTTGN